MTQTLTPLAAFDIASDGTTRPVTDPWPAPRAGAAGYRWLHCALSDPALPAWMAQNLPLPAANALLQPETRPRCDSHDGGLVVNLRGINMNPGAETDDMVSVRLWVTPALVVTVRMRKIFALDEIRQAAAQGHAPATPGNFLEALTRALTDRLEAVSVALDDEADALEERIIDDDDLAAPTLAPTRRKALRLRRFVGPQRDALNRLWQADTPIIGAADRPALAETANRATRSFEELDAVAARLAALQDHVNVAHGARMGRNGYVLSVVAAIFLPLGFLTGLFGVNVAGMPGTDSPAAFALLSVAMVVIGLTLYGVLRWMKWF